MFFDVPLSHTQNTGVCISGFDHVWEVHVPLQKLEYVASPLPPPYEAYGSMANFILTKCLHAHAGTCRDHTLALAIKHSEKVPTVFAQYNTIFGIARNKRDALNTKKKRAAKEESSESEIELVESEDEEDEDEEELNDGDHVEDQGDQGDQGDQDQVDQNEEGDQDDEKDDSESDED
jgi:hypothetical protein